MKLKLKYFALWLILISPAIFTSCSEDFLDVTDPTVLATSVFPASLNDLDPIVAEIYGRLQNGYFSAYLRNSVLMDHSEDHGYNGAEFNECALLIVNQDMAYVTNMWFEMYLNIGKCNNFLKVEEEFKAKGTLTAADLTRLDQMEGQVRFVRAFNYFYLVNMFGESPILTEADKAKMGVPVWDVQPITIIGTTKARSTQGEVYDFIIADLKAAETLLKGVVFSQKPRVNEWAVKSLLGKVYNYTLQYDLAKTKLKEVIDNSGKKLVSYDIFRNMFHGDNEFNTESVFEVNYTPDPLNTSGSNVTMYNTGNRYEVYVSVSYISSTGAEANNGFGNLFVHDRNIPRYGFDDTTTVNQNRPDYIAKSKQVRVDKSVDMRLYVSMYQPYVDSIYYENVWRKITKNRCESYSNVNKKAWVNGKYNLTNILFSKVPYNGINMIAIRLADVYLLYAEALIKSSAPDPALALEYINKVHRRAYNQPVDAASPYDYTSLTARTKTVESTDPLANAPLMYERWAELFAEGHWWFDVRRFGLGGAEAAYYKRVMGGTLVWADTKYALPIPTSEINSNSLIVQNP
jgi:starch-binding outer membrane protein, SusD/RagB family